MCLKHLFGLSILSVLFLVSLASSEEAANRIPAIDPQANEILKRMGQCLADANEFTVVAHKMTDYMLDTGQKIQLSDTTQVVVRRPNKIWAESKGDTQDEQVWYDGQTLTIFSPQDKVYGAIEVPDTIDLMMDYVVEKLHLAVPLADLLFSKPYQMAMANVRSGQYLGLHYAGDVKCHHLAFRQEGLDWQIWIAEGDLPVPRKLIITQKDLPGHPQFIAFLDQWNMSPKIAADRFKFEIPPGSQKVDLLAIVQNQTAGPQDAADTQKQSPPPQPK